jgi:hypothetical protein
VIAWTVYRVVFPLLASVRWRWIFTACVVCGKSRPRAGDGQHPHREGPTLAVPVPVPVLAFVAHSR